MNFPKNGYIKGKDLSNLIKYKEPNVLKKEVFVLLMNNMNSESKEKWNQIFERLDVDKVGQIKISSLLNELGKCLLLKTII